MKRGHMPKEMASKSELIAAIDDVIVEAEGMARQTVIPKSNAERTNNIRDNRAAEKERNRKQEAFVLGETGNQQSVETDKKEEISDTMKMIIKDLEERLSE
jgi:hypothetical protein